MRFKNLLIVLGVILIIGVIVCSIVCFFNTNSFEGQLLKKGISEDSIIKNYQPFNSPTVEILLYEENLENDVLELGILCVSEQKGIIKTYLPSYIERKQYTKSSDLDIRVKTRYLRPGDGELVFHNFVVGGRLNISSDIKINLFTPYIEFDNGDVYFIEKYLIKNNYLYYLVDIGYEHYNLESGRIDFYTIKYAD